MDSEFLKITQTHQVLPAQFHLAHLNLDTYSEGKKALSLLSGW